MTCQEPQWTTPITDDYSIRVTALTIAVGSAEPDEADNGYLTDCIVARAKAFEAYLRGETT
jgi:hypothetical protein